MISRHWRGLAKPAQADAYVEHLRTETFPGLQTMPGFISASILRRSQALGVEFLVVTRWASLEAIHGFAGDDAEMAVVPRKVQDMMVEYDRRACHYEVVL
ncbi:antibiotic biosynthesis monooxygenase [Variovorax paradoxus]|nr:antibiotic biosynthesis monooxygenase [Variovorax paradoxus]